MLISFCPVPINLLLLNTFLLMLLMWHAMLQPFRGWAQNAMDTVFQVGLLGITLLTLYINLLNRSANGRLADVNDVAKGNAQISDTIGGGIEVALLVLVVTSTYISTLLVITCQLLNQFPSLKRFMVQAWYILTCKKKPAAAEKRSSLVEVNINSSPEPPSYGSTEAEEYTPRTIPTFSELREPLLESAGSVCMENL